MKNIEYQEATRALIFDNERRVLLARRAGGHGIGLWSLFGGKIDKGEAPAEAVAREVLEEAGLTFTPIPFIDVYDEPENEADKPWHNWYFSGPVSGELKLDREAHTEWGYFAEEEIRGLEIAFGQAEVIICFFRHRLERQTGL